VCCAVRTVRKDPALMSGFAAIAVAVSVLVGIATSYANRAEPKVDLAMMMSTPFVQFMPADQGLR
jgi:hypothetical protein